MALTLSPLPRCTAAVLLLYCCCTAAVLLLYCRPHQVYAAGDLSDPHGTHRTCLQALFRALDSAVGRDWYRACATEVLLYRGAWQVGGCSADHLLLLLRSMCSALGPLPLPAAAAQGRPAASRLLPVCPPPSPATSSPPLLPGCLAGVGALGG